MKLNPKLFGLCLLLAACGQAPSTPLNPVAPPSSAITARPLGALSLEMYIGEERNQETQVPAAHANPQTLNGLRSQGFPAGGDLTFSQASYTMRVLGPPERWTFTASFRVTNTTTQALQRLTLVARARDGQSLGNTALSRIEGQNGSLTTDPALARAFTGINTINSSGTVIPGSADFQGYRLDEAAQLEGAAIASGALPANDYLLNYGFVVRASNTSRTIPAVSCKTTPQDLCNTGTVSVTFQTPAFPYTGPGSIPSLPLKLTFESLLVTDGPNRVTRSEETTASAVARAQGFAVTEVGLVGSDTDVATPLSTVRIPLVRTFVDPSVTEASATIGPAGGVVRLYDSRIIVPAGAVSGSAQFRLERVTAASLPLLPSDELIGQIGSGTEVGSYRVTTSATSLAQPVIVLMAVTPTTVSYTDVTTELYAFDGTTYDKVQIGDSSPQFAQFVLNLPQLPGFPLPNGIIYRIVRASNIDLANRCVAANGTWNGKYCQRPFGTPSPLPGGAYRLMSFNAGTADLDCLPYQVKLCRYSAEEKARKAIGDTNPDLLAIQEVWHNFCDINAPKEAAIETVGDLATYQLGSSAGNLVRSQAPTLRVPPRILADYVCSRPDLNSATGSTQMGRIVGHTNYAIRCSKATLSQSLSRYINGYECSALKRTKFEYVSPWTNGEGATRGQEQISSYLTDPCSVDTGFQLELVRLAGTTRGPLSTPFSLANAHLNSPGSDLAGVCQGNQIFALANFVRTNAVRSLVTGDFNTDDQAFNLGVQLFSSSAPVLNSLVSPSTSAVDRLPVRDLTDPFNTQNGWLWYWLSNPDDPSAVYLGLNLTLDHVLSNFAYRTANCVRQSAGAFFDHKYTTCGLAGFESGQFQYRVFEDLIDYPAPGTPNPIAEPFPALQRTFIAVSRYGVLLPYTAILSNPTNTQGQLTIGVPDGQPVSVTLFNFRCNPYPRVTITPAINTTNVVGAGLLTPIQDLFFSTPQQPNNWCL